MAKFQNESWVEKFRPKKLNDIVSQENVISSMKGILKDKYAPLVIFWSFRLW